MGEYNISNTVRNATKKYYDKGEVVNAIRVLRSGCAGLGIKLSKCYVDAGCPNEYILDGDVIKVLGVTREEIVSEMVRHTLALAELGRQLEELEEEDDG